MGLCSRHFDDLRVRNYTMKAKMLLELVMIVKNAGPDFGRVLKSVQPHIDEWTILDTGSEDQTIETIESVMVDKPGAVHTQEFIDFATSRNKAIELSSGRCTFQIMMTTLPF